MTQVTTATKTNCESSETIVSELEDWLEPIKCELVKNGYKGPTSIAILTGYLVGRLQTAERLLQQTQPRFNELQRQISALQTKNEELTQALRDERGKTLRLHRIITLGPGGAEIISRSSFEETSDSSSKSWTPAKKNGL